MKGIGKAFKRTPFMVTSKVGMAKKSTDAEFNELQRRFALLETATEKFLKETKSFTTAVVSVFASGEGFATHFATVFKPIAGEIELISKHPDTVDTLRNVEGYESVMEDIKVSITPELELIESRVVAPVKEFQGVLKTIRKTITKRDHKLMDYDRFNNSLTKLRDKKEKSLNDEKNLFKLEQDYEVSTNEYEYINNALKNDLPHFMLLCTHFIEPLFQSYFYMQLNLVYTMLDKLTTFAEGKYEVSGMTSARIIADYEEKRTDAWHQIENLNIIKKIISVSRLVQAHRAQSGTSGSSSSSSRTLSSYAKKTPPPPPPSLSASHAPPPYSAKDEPPRPGLAPKPVMTAKPLLSPKPPFSSKPPFSPNPANGNSAPVKRPPPPPPVKPKPRPNVQHVVALYDYTAQAEGDLSFKVGDQIEVVERSANAEDWWTGKLNGVKGVFPGNYVQDIS